MTTVHEPGFCPVCESDTLFDRQGPWLRDQLVCMRCGSIPRWRTLHVVLDGEFPTWRTLAIHESSPGGAASNKLAAECPSYVGTHFFPDVPPGSSKGGVRCENLERQTFASDSFDLVITQDVFEHVLHPDKAFAEVARTLKPGGAHVFTIPWYYWQRTRVRAVEEDGEIRHLLPPEYHGNPIDASGSLVVTEWGLDFLDYIERCTGLDTTVHHLWDPRRAIDGDFREVFVSRK
jgi:SAM-dependent methyltransferase